MEEFQEIAFEYLPRSQNQFADALATLSSILQVAGGLDIEPLRIEIFRHPAYCMTIEEEPDGQPWYHDILKYLQKGEFLEGSEATDRKYLIKLASKFFASGDVLYKVLRLDIAKMNGVVEAANKNIKKILSKTVENYRDWHDRLPYALMAYRTSIRTSTGATPFSLVYGMEAVLPVEVEVPSLRVLSQSMLDEASGCNERHERLNLIDEKRLQAVCYGQCYQRRVTKAFN
ncbi:uncharacterized protein LOC120294094 [Eucalyptus grandis]|uniref:uncharacterized protein LOC120294094 n=1 Tax=Eucalyptus grandis TaxID=71139 RepID=UPI00192EA2B3|nr:uncharacterized protein LOC120294094 [Eucalyptus grandis]